jgi:hypothetical protein
MWMCPLLVVWFPCLIKLQLLHASTWKPCYISISASLILDPSTLFKQPEYKKYAQVTRIMLTQDLTTQFISLKKI